MIRMHKAAAKLLLPNKIIVLSSDNSRSEVAEQMDDRDLFWLHI